MAKKLKKVLALALTMSMCMSFVTTTAFAQDNQNDTDTPAVTQPTDQDPAEGADDIALTGTVEVQTKPDGTTESINVTISVEPQADGTVAVEQQTPEVGVIAPSGAEVDYQATSVVKPAEQPAEQTDDETGDETKVTGELLSQEYQYTAETKDGVLSVQGGTETNEETILPGEGDEVSAGVELYDEQGNLKQPTQEDPLKAQGSSETASPETKPTDEGDATKAENSANFDQTTTTTTDRVVDMTINAIEVTTGDLLFVDETGNPVYYDEDGDPVYVRVNEDGSTSFVDEEGIAVEFTTDDGYHYEWIGFHDINGVAEGSEGFTSWRDDRAQTYVIKADGTKVKVGSDGLGIRAVIDNNTGEIFGGLYCVDFHTGNQYDVPYRRVNLEDAVRENYFDEEDAAHLRAILNNGFTSRGDGKGNVNDNLDEFIGGLLTAKANGAPELAGISEEAINALTAWDAVSATGMAVWQYANRFTESEYNPDAGDKLVFECEDDTRWVGGPETEHETVVEAIYSYLITLTEEPSETVIINEENFIDDMELVVGSMVQSDDADHANNDDDDTNDVYDVSLKFSLVVTPGEGDDLIVKVLDNHGNVVQSARIAGEDSDGTADYAKTETDENGKTYYILEGMQLTENSDTEFNLKLEGTQHLTEGVYVFESVEPTMAEYVEDTFQTWTTDEEWAGEQSWAYGKIASNYPDRMPEGVKKASDLTKDQYKELIPLLYGKENERFMKDGVLDMNAPVSQSQNLIGKFEGEAEVNVGMSINLTFNVEESTVTTKREWRDEEYEEYYDDDDDEIVVVVTPDNTPIVEPTPTPDPVPQNGDLPIPEFEIPEEDVPLAELPDEDVPLAEQPLMELPEDPIPLANVPKTGDTSGMWYAMTAAAALALAVMMLTEKRKEEN